MRHLVSLLVAALTSAPGIALAQEASPGSDPAVRTVILNRAPPPLGFSVKFSLTDGGPDPYPEIITVVPGSNAALAGMAVGDTLLSVNGRDASERTPLFPDRTPGTKYTMRVRRDGEDIELIFSFPVVPPAAPPRGTRPR
ncbi:MAG TPA: PDZ domain-containing protein [Longimicrobium sp.]|nr:PDZ domain-containing protein [Longimicrobium sp.]